MGPAASANVLVRYWRTGSALRLACTI